MGETEYINIEVKIPASSARVFLDAMTGNDDDVLLAAERAIRNRLEEDYYREGEREPFEEVELAFENEREVRAALKLAADHEAATDEPWMGYTPGEEWSRDERHP